MTDAQWSAVWALIRACYPTMPHDLVVEKAWRSNLNDLDRDDVMTAIRMEFRGSDGDLTLAAVRRGANNAARDRKFASDGNLKLEAPFVPIPEKWAISGEEALRRIQALSDGMAMEPAP